MNLYPSLSDESDSNSDSSDSEEENPLKSDNLASSLNSSQIDKHPQTDSYLSPEIQKSLIAIVTKSLDSSEINVKTTSFLNKNSNDVENNSNSQDELESLEELETIKPLVSSRKKRNRKSKNKKVQLSKRHFRSQIKSEILQNSQVVTPKLNTETLEIQQPEFTKRRTSKYARTRAVTAESILPSNI